MSESVAEDMPMSEAVIAALIGAIATIIAAIIGLVAVIVSLRSKSPSLRDHPSGQVPRQDAILDQHPGIPRQQPTGNDKSPKGKNVPLPIPPSLPPVVPAQPQHLPSLRLPDFELTPIAPPGDSTPPVECEPPTNIPEALEQAAIELQAEYPDGIPRNALIQRAHQLLRGCCSLASIIPSDYCHNRENKGGRKRKMFLWREGGCYEYVGEGYMHTGDVIRRPRDG